jgi:hypothetical protein
MRLEGRNRGSSASTAQKSRERQGYHVVRRPAGQMYGRLHLRVRQVPRHRDVASASELPAADLVPLEERDDVDVETD